MFFNKVLFVFPEDVIRRRLLIDGDGTGDDRRLNVLLKSFIKWCNTKYDSPVERYGLMLNFLFLQLLYVLCQVGSDSVAV